MSNKNRIKYVKLMNFNDDANKVFNKAIQLAEAENCAVVTAVHLFLALVEKMESDNKRFSDENITFDMLYDSYQMLASQEEYGYLEDTSKLYEMNNLSEGLFQLIANTSAFGAMHNKVVTVDNLMNSMLEFQPEEFCYFLDYADISLDRLRGALNSKFCIPEDIVDFVEDLTNSKNINEDSISNVDNYTDEIIEILSRKLKANPCLVGEAGVGKTTIVKALAQKIKNGDVPKGLKESHIIYINSALLTSGTRYRGDFEERMKTLLDWASKSNVILFLDELHTFINLGKNGEGSADTAGNMIKKHLSDGSIKIIGATTTKEYHSYIEKDSAFDRRLQVVDVKEPSLDGTISMIKNTIVDYENFHNVKISDETIESAVKLSDRYIKHKYFPDKAYTLLDQASAKVKLDGRKDVITEDIVKVISKNTGIDLNKVSTTEAKQLLKLEDTIHKNLVGQDEAVKTICKAIRRSKVGIREANKPIASFLFVGPTGVGKTELCKVLSKEVALGDASFIKIDMSEFSEKHSISKFLGTAPGYLGYGEGGQLTEKVKHNPYSLILFDEIEKAHPEVFNIFLQLLDEGKLTDGEGNTVDFTNCIIVMTSNAGYGADAMNKKSLGFGVEESVKSYVDMEKIALKALEETFKPELLNRIDNVVIFEKLSKEQCRNIVKLMLNKTAERLYDQHNIKITFSNSVIDKIVESGYSDKYGARNIRREIQNTVEDFIADAILTGEMKKDSNVTISLNRNNLIIKEKI